MYTKYLSQVCINRNYDLLESIYDKNPLNRTLYYYLHEETSDLIKEYRFARDLISIWNNSNEMPFLALSFGHLIEQIAMKLSEDLTNETETIYQTFAGVMISTPDEFKGLPIEK